MNLSGGQEVAVFGIVVAFIVAVFGLGFGLGVAFISDTNQEAIGHWFDRNDENLWPYLGWAIPAAGTYLLGRRAGRKVGKTEAYSSAIGIVQSPETASDIVNAIQQDARNNKVSVDA